VSRSSGESCWNAVMRSWRSITARSLHLGLMALAMAPWAGPELLAQSAGGAQTPVADRPILLAQNDDLAEPPPPPPLPDDVLVDDESPDQPPPEPSVSSVNPAKNIPPGEELVTIDFPEPTAIKDIIKAVAQWTGKNFILGQGVSSSARVAIISPQQITKEEAYQAFLSALNVAGFTTVDTGRVVKIIPTRQATSSNIKTFYGSSWAPMTDEIITQIIPLSYIDAQTVARQLRSILRESNAVPFPTTNSLIVSDTGHKIRRLLEIIKLLDVKGNQPQVAIVPILYTDANDIAKKIQDIFGRAGSRGGASLYLQKVIVDERTNSTILIGPPKGLDDVARLIKRLDRPLDEEAQQAGIHVRPLEYADAQKLAATLQSLTQSSASRSNSRLRTPVATRRLTTPNGTDPTRNGEGGDINAVADLGNVKITADVATNALIIQGSSAAYREVDNIIRLLDQKKAQVYIEADIIDVNVGKGLEIGGSAFAGLPTSSSDPYAFPYGWKPAAVGGFSALSNSSSVTSQQAATLFSAIPQRAVFGVLAKEPIEIVNGLKITPGAFIFALKNDSNANVLQTPSMLVQDNQEAEFNATEKEIVFVQETNAQTGTASQKPESIDAELSLKIKPQITKSDEVNMDLNLKADSFGRRDASGKPAQTVKRSFNSKVSVQDSQTIVISGLQKDIEIESFSKVPLLGDIPILGWLFRDSNTTRQKTNLMIFLTPYVIRDAVDLSRVYDKKLRDQTEFLEKFYGEDFREKEVFERLPTRADGRVPPEKLERTSESLSPDPEVRESPALPVRPEREQLELPSQDPDPIVVPGGDSGGGSSFGGGGDSAPPPPPPPPAEGGGDGGDIGGDGGGEG
jgi:general secretion pathway protein D